VKDDAGREGSIRRRKMSRKLSAKQDRSKGKQRRARAFAKTKRKTNVPRTAKQFFAKPKDFQDTWTRVTHVISKMRADRVSLREASREFGVEPRIVARLGKCALRK